MSPGEIKQILAHENIHLTKSLGQNFLHDANQLKRIVETANLVRTDRVLEIGPGLGALTQFLIERVPNVLAIEKDNRLSQLLRKRIPDERRLVLVQTDALEYLRDRREDWSDWKLVANLPYSVASLILVEFAKEARPPRGMAVTVQWEVAQRLAASAGDESYGVLTLLVQLRYDVGVAFKIPPSCFFPAPEVDSACVKLTRRTEVPLSPAQFGAFERIVKRGFSQRRKMLLKLLKADWAHEKLAQAFDKVGLSAQVRAESVTLEQFVKMTKILAPTEGELL